MPGLKRALSFGLTLALIVGASLLDYIVTGKMSPTMNLYSLLLLHLLWSRIAFRYIGRIRKTFSVLIALIFIMLFFSSFYFEVANPFNNNPMLLLLGGVVFLVGVMIVYLIPTTEATGCDATGLRRNGTTPSLRLNATLRNTMVMVTVATTCLSVICVGVTFFCFGMYEIGLPSLTLAMALAVYAAFDAWLLGKIRLERNKWFFKMIVKAGKREETHADAPIFKLANRHIAEAAFFLTSLVNPAECVTRIREKVVPDASGCKIDEEIEFRIPDKMALPMNARLPRTLAIPIALQGKSELTAGLEICAEDGSSLHKLNDSEMEIAVCDSLAVLLCSLSKAIPSKIKSGVREFYCAAMKDGLWEGDNAFRSRKDEAVTNLVGSLGILDDCHNKELKEFLSAFMDSFRFAKPICVKLEVTPASPFTITVSRITPLVPIRVKAIRGVIHDRKGGGAAFRARVMRLFTKRRRCYYFGLGNADRCKSFHLTFQNPCSSYLMNSALMARDGRNDISFADRAVVTSRGDQNYFKMFIRNGRGFNRVSLFVSFLPRSHRTMAFMCWTAVISFVFLAYVALSCVPEFHGCRNAANVEMVTLCFAVLALSAVAAVWEAMERDRAEEWLWLSSGGSVVVAACALLYIVLLAIAPEMVGGRVFFVL